MTVTDRPTTRIQPTRLNLPNALCGVRLIGAFVLVAMAFAGLDRGFVILLVALVLTDWADGRLAVWLDQRTDFGAMLDSVADMTLYAAVLFGLFLMRGETMAQAQGWVVAAVASYAIPFAASFVKFGRMPSFHTWLAKATWVIVNFAAILVFLGASPLPVKAAAAVAVLTNAEILAMVLILRNWRTNVPTIWSAIRDR